MNILSLKPNKIKLYRWQSSKNPNIWFILFKSSQAGIVAEGTRLLLMTQMVAKQYVARAGEDMESQ